MTTQTNRFLPMLPTAACLLGMAACSSSGTSTGTTTTLVTQTGRTVQYTPCSTSPTAVAGATVTVGGESATTAKDGTYSIKVPAGAPFTMTVVKTTDPSYVQLLEEENTVTADYDRGDTMLIDSSTASILSSALPSYETTRALITIELVKTGSCTDLGGTTVQVSPASTGALMQYPAACVTPIGANAYATDGVFPAAVIYNLDAGMQSVSASSPKCTQIPFPYTDPATGLTYDGKVETQAGTGTSFAKIFMR